MATVEELCKALWDITESDRPDQVLTLTGQIVDAAEARGVEKERARAQDNDVCRSALATLATQAKLAHDTGKYEGLEQGRAEGAAVGVSAARRQLRAASASVTKQEGTRSINGVRHYLIPVREFSVPIASVLAPTKEKP